MNQIVHLIFALIFGFLFYKIGIIPSIPLLLLFLSWSILIDIDHPIYLIGKHKSFKILEDLKYHRKNMKPEAYIFHSPEFNIILFIFAFFNKVALTIFLANIIHIPLDIIEHTKYHKNLKWIKSWSILGLLKKY